MREREREAATAKSEHAELVEARPPGIAKHTATTKSELAVMDDARPPGIAKYEVASESEFAESAGEAGSLCPGTTGTTSADVTAVTKTTGEARLPGCARHRVPREKELAELGRHRGGQGEPLVQFRSLVHALLVQGIHAVSERK